MNTYIELKDLEVYQLSRELSSRSWLVYEKMDWQTRKVISDQFVRAVDSVGANIAEGYGRHHKLDKIKFYYNSRASLREACDHWLELLFERKFIDETEYIEIRNLSNSLSLKLQNFINATYKNLKQ